MTTAHISGQTVLRRMKDNSNKTQNNIDIVNSFSYIQIT